MAKSAFMWQALAGVTVVALAVATLLTLALPHFLVPAQNSSASTKFTDTFSDTIAPIAQTQPARSTSVTVRFYATRGSTELLASEHFAEVPITNGTFTITLGSQPSSAWTSTAFADLDALLQAHTSAWYSVTIASNGEPARRYRVTSADRDHCNC